jgi:hypothetical protein
MPESLTRKKRRQPTARVAGFKSEWWPDLFRNGGRLQIGTPAGFTSEHPAGLNRNPQSDRCGWSGWRKKKDRENCKCNVAERQNTFPASQTTTENCPTGKSAKTCPAPLTKIFRLTRRANHLYKLVPSHPGRGGSRVVTNARWDAMDATASGAQWDRRAGLPVSDRPARGRTRLLTVFARTRRTARGPARPLAWTVADGEVVWSWRPDAGVKFCGDAFHPTGSEMHLSSARRRWQESPVTGESTK